MKKRLFALCLALVLLATIAGLSCEAEEQGTIEVKATLCGDPWPGAVQYALTTTEETIDGTSVAEAFTVEPATWTCAYISGGPSRAYLADITPSPTQALGAGGAITFTMNFELAQDAGIEFISWTINGARVQPNPPKNPYIVTWGDVIGVHFKQHVAGCEGKLVMVGESSELLIHYDKGVDSIELHAVNEPDGVVKAPHAEKPSQVLILDGVPVLPDSYHGLVFCTPKPLEVETVWQLEKCTDYVKTINWLRIGEELLPVNGTRVLSELVLDGLGPCSLELVASASVELMDDEDVNPNNNHAESPPLYVVVSLGL